MHFYSGPPMHFLSGVDKRNAYDGPPRRPNPRAVLIDLAQKRAAPVGQIDAIRLGKWLTKHENTIALDLKLTVDRSDSRRSDMASGRPRNVEEVGIVGVPILADFLSHARARAPAFW